MKYSFGQFQQKWHYIDNPWLDQGGDIDDYSGFKFYELNLTTAVPDIEMWLRGEKGYDETETYEKMLEKFDATDAKSLALRLLIHYVGDFHQPLHNMNKVDDDWPTGD